MLIAASGNVTTTISLVVGLLVINKFKAQFHQILER